MDQLGLGADDGRHVRELVESSLRKIIYNPDGKTRAYLLRLSTTYFLLFALKNDPRVVEYFNSLAEKLVLYVGSDLIIKALSEYHLPIGSRMISNTFDVLVKSGAKLIMAEPAFEEVFSHIHASVLEFENYYAPCESSIDEQLVHTIDRILIRAYFYVRLGLNVEGRGRRLVGVHTLGSSVVTIQLDGARDKRRSDYICVIALGSNLSRRS